ncbi:hypothetical protein PAXY110619_29990 [Paenibacillus xylanexedens]|uniref:Uncharacterized protein n=1 Tax=Paenibacillus xylanexedens TaxID=528191 RepID=A0ABS4RU59_PAEXY|nr:hypothetical protein [Paenibacillus xylanexedens]
MGLWSKQQIQEFIKKNNLVSAQDAQNAIKDLFAETFRRCWKPRWIPTWSTESMK